MPNLKPFTADSETETNTDADKTPFHISAQMIHQEMEHMVFEFHIEGDLGKIKWPDTFQSREERRNELWKHTCFEVFLAANRNEETPYFEVNCSPNGDWNLYHLSGYRKDLKPYYPGRVSLLERENTDHGLRFIIGVEGLPASPWHIGLTAVIEEVSGKVTYWALAHPGKTADFHDKRGFIL